MAGKKFYQATHRPVPVKDGTNPERSLQSETTRMKICANTEQIKYCPCCMQSCLENFDEGGL